MRLNAAGFALMVTVACIAFPGRAWAQGFWLGAGGGYGTATLSCVHCDERESSASWYVAGGRRLSPRTLVGLELRNWSKELTIDAGSPPSGEVRGLLSIGSVSGTLALYPLTAGLFLKGRLGWSFVEFTCDTQACRSLQPVEINFGDPLLSVGVGFDIPIRWRMSITPAVDYWHGGRRDLTLATTADRDRLQTSITATIGVTFK